MYDRFRLDITNYFAKKGYDDRKVLTMMSHEKIHMLVTFFSFYKDWEADKERYNQWFFEHLQPFLDKYELSKDDIKIEYSDF